MFMIKRANEQQAFETAITQIIVQGRQSMDTYGTCLYRGPDGTRCGIGALITNKEYRKGMECKSVHVLGEQGLLPLALLDFDMYFLKRIQELHDFKWELGMYYFILHVKEAAKDFHLDTKFLEALQPRIRQLKKAQAQ